MPSNTFVLIERVPIEYSDAPFQGRWVHSSHMSDFTAVRPSSSLEPGLSKPYPNAEQPNLHDSSALNQFKQGANNAHPPSTQAKDSQQVDQSSNAKAFPDQTSGGFPAQPVNFEVAVPVFTEEEYEKALDNGRFFVMRSSNAENINLSRAHSEWATTKQNQHHLHNAFSSSDFVFLIFTISKSRFFPGFALMTSGVSNKIGAYWITNESLKLGGCFKVTWITTKELNFMRANHINNVENEPVTKSRDCTELDKESGKELCKLFAVPFREPGVACQLPPSFLNVLGNNQGKNDPKKLPGLAKTVEEKRKEGEVGKRAEGEATGSINRAMLSDGKGLDGLQTEVGMNFTVNVKNQSKQFMSVVSQLTKSDKLSEEKLQLILKILNENEGEEGHKKVGAEGKESKGGKDDARVAKDSDQRIKRRDSEGSRRKQKKDDRSRRRGEGKDDREDREGKERKARKGFRERKDAREGKGRDRKSRSFSSDDLRYDSDDFSQSSDSGHSKDKDRRKSKKNYTSKRGKR